MADCVLVSVIVATGLKKMADEISDPEARGVAERAHTTLLRVGAEGQATAPKPASKEVWLREGSRLVNVME